MFDYFKKIFGVFQTKDEPSEEDFEKYEEELLSKINFHETEVEELPNNLLHINETIGKSPTEELDVEVFESIRKTGKITHLGADYGIIDNSLYFERGQISSFFQLQQNDEIIYTAFKARENETERVYKIHGLKNDMWDDDEKKSESETDTNEEVGEIQTLLRVVSGRVVKRKGRECFIEELNIWCHLDKIEASYVPIEGDWVSLEASVTVDGEAVDLAGDILEIKSLQPLMKKTGTGRVSFWSAMKGEGVIENVIYFTKVICTRGYVPSLGDEVSYSAIESDQERYKLRALSVSPKRIVENKNKYDNIKFFAEKNGILIQPSVCVIEIELYKSMTVTLEVTNNRDFEQTLTKTNFNSSKSKSQLVLKSPNLNDSFVIQPKEKLNYVFECKAKFLGLNCETFVFYFKNFTIARKFEINVMGTSEMNKLLPCKIDTVINVIHDLKYVRNNINAEEVLYGPRPWKAPKFCPGEKRGVYRVPDKLSQIFEEDGFSREKHEIIKGLEEYAPYLCETLNFPNYTEKFHTLLYLEEIEIKRNIRRYDLNGVILLRQDKFLVLEVPGLIEQRPSLIVGDKVILSQPWSETNKTQQIGYIHEIHQKDIYVKFHYSFHNSYDESESDIIFEPSVTTLMRCHDAVNRGKKKLGSKWLFPSSVDEKPPQIEFEISDEVQNLTQNVANFFNEVSKSQKVSSPQKSSEINGNNGEKAVSNILTLEKLEKENCSITKKKLTWFNKKLNERQKLAVINILKGQGRPLPYIIFGPPGTGKTFTLVEVIIQIYCMIPESRILVTTPSNSSADLICERLIEFYLFRPGNLVRLLSFNKANEGNIPLKLVPYSAIVEIKGDRTNDIYKNSNQSNNQLPVASQVIGRHRITVGTCCCVGSLHYLGFPPGHFTHILVDEAGQATEPEVLISTTFQNLQSGQVILAGDPQQLGPVCVSKYAESYGLGNSLLQRLVSEFPYVRDFDAFPTTSGYDPRFITKLNTNYRTVPEILSLPNQLFYNSELIATVSQTEGTEADIIQKFNFMGDGGEKPAAIVFHGVIGQNYQENDSPSWFNPHEVWLAITYLIQLYNIGLNSDDIGIVTPYLKQVQKLRYLINALGLSLPKIGTVEDFQGQERYVIIVSTVRSSLSALKIDISHCLGFVASPRRLNVALTRARALVIIIGNPIILSKDPYWKNVVEYCVKNKSYTGYSLNLSDKNTI